MRLLTITAWTLALLAAPAVAKVPGGGGTPDGDPPPREPDCDSFSGKANGLCVAYCEAMDCDDPRSNADPSACASTAESFERATGGAKLPCLPLDPPCDVDAIDDFLDMEEPGTYPISLLDNDTVVPSGRTIYVAAIQPVEDVTILDSARGQLQVSWVDDGNAFVRRFEYTACCRPGSCDTATVTLLGS